MCWNVTRPGKKPRSELAMSTSYLSAAASMIFSRTRSYGNDIWSANTNTTSENTT